VESGVFSTSPLIITQLINQQLCDLGYLEDVLVRDEYLLDFDMSLSSNLSS
jgi:hypothetical protein